MIDMILMAKELADLREKTTRLVAAMDTIHARAAAVLNNGFPDEAPEALAGICKVAADALRPPMSKAAIETEAASFDLGHLELGRERPREPSVGETRDMANILRKLVEADDRDGFSDRLRRKINVEQGGECDDADAWMLNAFDEARAMVKKLNARI